MKRVRNEGDREAGYDAPEITVIEVEVEQGFATSIGGSINGGGNLNPAGYDGGGGF